MVYKIGMIALALAFVAGIIHGAREDNATMVAVCFAALVVLAAVDIFNQMRRRI